MFDFFRKRRKPSLRDDYGELLAESDRQARALQHEYLGTEHAMLAILQRKAPEVQTMLTHCQVEDALLLNHLTNLLTLGPVSVARGPFPLTPQLQQVLEGAKQECEELDCAFSDRMVLVHLARDNEGVAGIVLSELGATEVALREAISSSHD